MRSKIDLNQIMQLDGLEKYKFILEDSIFKSNISNLTFIDVCYRLNGTSPAFNYRAGTDLSSLVKSIGNQVSFFTKETEDTVAKVLLGANESSRFMFNFTFEDSLTRVYFTNNGELFGYNIDKLGSVVSQKRYAQRASHIEIRYKGGQVKRLDFVKDSDPVCQIRDDGARYIQYVISQSNIHGGV